MNAPAPTTSRYSTIDRMIEWLRKHHHQSSGAARNLRASAAANTTDPLLTEQKRKAADAASANAACYHEIAEALLTIRTARQCLANIENGSGLTNVTQRNHFVNAVDRALSMLVRQG